MIIIQSINNEHTIETKQKLRCENTKLILHEFKHAICDLQDFVCHNKNDCIIRCDPNSIQNIKTKAYKMDHALN